MQVRFSEVSVDLFRMALALENDAAEASNPYKYLLYRPTPTHVCATVATMLHESESQADALLVYVAAQAWDSHDRPPPANTHGASSAADAQHNLPRAAPPHRQDPAEVKEPDNAVGVFLPSRSQVSSSGDREGLFCWHDLLFATRRPLVVLVDSRGPCGFHHLATNAGALVLAGPEAWPTNTEASAERGSLLTCLLVDPVAGLLRCLRSGMSLPSLVAVQEARTVVDGRVQLAETVVQTDAMESGGRSQGFAAGGPHRRTSLTLPCRRAAPVLLRPHGAPPGHAPPRAPYLAA